MQSATPPPAFAHEVEQIRTGMLTELYRRELRQLQWRICAGIFGGGFLVASGIALLFGAFNVGISDLSSPLDNIARLLPLLAWAAILPVLGAGAAFFSFTLFLDLEATAYQAQRQYLGQLLEAAQRHGFSFPDDLDKVAALLRGVSSNASS